jgi:acetoacetyl-CoA reductase
MPHLLLASMFAPRTSSGGGDYAKSRGYRYGRDARHRRRNFEGPSAISKALHSSGYRVAAVYAANNSRAGAFRDQTGIQVYRWDVADFDACQRGTRQVAADLGSIEILINNAGITRDGTLHKMTSARWKEVIETNLGGCFNMTRSVIESMRERRFGRIVNISSINGQIGQAGQTNYAAAKAGILGFTKSLALENAAKGITVNSVAPGYTETEMVAAIPPDILKSIIQTIPSGRLGRPDEIARSVLFLVADEASFVTGATLTINGGQCMI